MIRVAVADLRARPLRLLATVLSVALGAAFVAGVLVLTDTVQESFDRRFVEGGRRADGVVRPAGGLQAQRYARVPGDVAAAVARTPGVGAVAPAGQEAVHLSAPDGGPLGRPDAVSALDRSRPYLGGWAEAPELREQRVRAGRAPAAPGEIAVHAHLAGAARLAVGGPVRVVLPHAAMDAKVVGVFDYGERDPAPTAPLFTPTVLADDAVAARYLGDPGELRLLAAPGTTPGELRAAVGRTLPSGYEIVPAAVAANDTFDVLWRSQMGPLATGLLVFAGISVLAGGLIVFTTFTITVARRTRRYALLRTVGAGRGQIAGAVLTEATAIGLAGGAAGLLFGIGLAAGLRRLLDAAGIDLVIGPGDPLVLRPGTVLAALLTGTAATIVAALPPAVRAGRVPPVQALREASIRPAAGRTLFRAGLAVLAIALATLAVTLRDSAGTESAVAARLVPLGAGAMGVFLAMALLAPRCTGPVAWLVGAPAATLRGLPARLARGNATRNPGRTALTATALLLGTGLVGFTLNVSASLSATQESRIRELTFTDYRLRATDLSSFPGAAGEAAAAVDGVRTVTAMRPAQLDLAGKAHAALGIQPRTLTQVTPMPMLQGDVQALAGDTGTGPARIALARDLAATLNVRAGDTLPVTFAADERLPARVVATFDPGRLRHGLDTDVLVSRDRAAAADPLRGDTLTMIELHDGVSPEQARPALKSALRGYPVDLQSAGEARAAASGRVGAVLGLGLGLLLLTVVIALFGITNALALAVTERTRELGLLRAVGMSRAQARATIRWEAVIVTLLGTLLGIALGTFFAWGTARAVPGEIDVFAPPAAWLAITVAVAVAAGLLAAAVPAHRASRVDVLRAMTTE